MKRTIKCKRRQDVPPESEEGKRAAIPFPEIESEERWADSFANSQDLLADLAAQARAEHAAGKTKPL